MVSARSAETAKDLLRRFVRSLMPPTLQNFHASEMAP
jgi:hypothetical protein